MQKVGGIKLLIFHINYKATIIKTLWYWSKDEHVDQRNRTESRKDPHISGEMIFNKGTTAIHGEKDNVFNK